MCCCKQTFAAPLPLVRYSLCSLVLPLLHFVFFFYGLRRLGPLWITKGTRGNTKDKQFDLYKSGKWLLEYKKLEGLFNVICLHYPFLSQATTPLIFCALRAFFAFFATNLRPSISTPPSPPGSSWATRHYTRYQSHLIHPA
jgi:hypothetical protein